LFFDVIPTVNIGNSFQLAPGKMIGDVTAYGSLGAFISAVLPSVFVISGIILFVLIIFGGLTMIISSGSGDAKKVEQGQQALTSAMIGMVIIFCAFWIIKIIEFVTGVKFF
jgi:hypothetical protein